MIRAMGAHGGSAGVQQYGCTALRNMVADSEECKASVTAAGGIEAVIRAMGAHGGSAGVQQHGCTALCNLAAGSK